MANHRKMLELAAEVSKLKDDNRTYRLGAVAIRGDDVLVSAYNGYPGVPTPPAHCEARLVRKLDKGAVVYLTRLSREGQWANSKPCPDCLRAMRRARVKRVYYTSGPNEWDSLEP